jgi:hypothetical protein
MATKDIWLFSASDNLEGELQLSLGNNAKQVKGIEKLVNMFVLVFLTDLETDLTDADVGTTLAEILSGNIYLNQSLMNALIALAIEDAAAVILSDQDTSLPADEQLLSVRLVESSVDCDTISVVVEITSEAGESRVIQVPNKFSL